MKSLSMPIPSLQKPGAFPATDTETGEELRKRHIDNLVRELPLASQRRADKHRRYVDALVAHIKTGNDPAHFRTLHPQLHLPDPDTALLYCMLGEECDVDYGASILGVPASALQLYCFIHEEKTRYEKVLAQKGEQVDAEDSAHRFAIEWISAVDPGDDISLLPTRLVHWLLSDPALGVADLAINPELRLAAGRIAVLHRRVLEGKPPGREEWKDVQRFFLDFMDSARLSSALGDTDSLVAQIMENAATDCSDSNVLGEEIVMPVAQLIARIQLPPAIYTAEETALKEHIERLREEKNASLAQERERPEIKALFVKMDDDHRRVSAMRAKVFARIATQFIAMTRAI